MFFQSLFFFKAQVVLWFISRFRWFNNFFNFTKINYRLQVNVIVNSPKTRSGFKKFQQSSIILFAIQNNCLWQNAPRIAHEVDRFSPTSFTYSISPRIGHWRPFVFFRRQIPSSLMRLNNVPLKFFIARSSRRDLNSFLEIVDAENKQIPTRDKLCIEFIYIHFFIL